MKRVGTRDVRKAHRKKTHKHMSEFVFLFKELKKLENTKQLVHSKLRDGMETILKKQTPEMHLEFEISS